MVNRFTHTPLVASYQSPVYSPESLVTNDWRLATKIRRIS